VEISITSKKIASGLENRGLEPTQGTHESDKNPRLFCMVAAVPDNGVAYTTSCHKLKFGPPSSQNNLSTPLYNFRETSGKYVRCKRLQMLVTAASYSVQIIIPYNRLFYLVI